MRDIRKIKNLRGKKILLRVDLNVPVKNGRIEDEFRINKALPTIKFLKKNGAKVILLSHFGKGGDTLEPLAGALSKYIKTTFVKAVTGSEAKKFIAEMKNGEVVLLENLRNDPGEKGGDKKFARELAALGDIYVNEAFSVSHRKDASIVLLPKLLPAYAGMNLVNEVEGLGRAMKTVRHPFLVIIGGAKFSTKLPLIKKYLKPADHIFIGGALAHEFFKARGYEVGESLVEEKGAESVKRIFKNKKIILPTDVKISLEGGLVNKKTADVSKGDVILDIGDESVEKLKELIEKAKLVFWNGPLGKYEDGGAESTKKILEALSRARAHSVVGGGDTAALVNQMKIEKKLSFVSTGGGAALYFLAHGTLPGIKALG